jgi:hypothetical protein
MSGAALPGGFLAGLWVSALLSAATLAQTSPITLTINASNPGYSIPTNFVGISVSSMSIDGDSGYTKCFTTANTQMVNLFKQIGVKHLRTIMGKANSSYPDPSNSQIDSFFDFAAAAGVNKIIWSLHLYNAGDAATNWSNNKAIATYIWNTTTASGMVERNLLESFAFDNEPDWLKSICCADPVITGYYTPTNNGYIDKWRTWCQAIRAAGVAPGASFSGPDTGSEWPAATTTSVNTSIGGVPFTLRFATDAHTNIITATQHFYGASSSGLSAAQMAEDCLSQYWVTNYYPVLANSGLAGATGWPTNNAGAPMPYRFTECSAFNNGGGNQANHIFATALWALDFYHWWAQQGCAGINPFTRTVQYNSPIFYDGTNYTAAAYAYSMKAFTLGSSGGVIYPGQFAISNPGNINLTAYGVVNSTNLYVTIINKTFDAVGSCAAAVSIPAPSGFIVKQAQYMVLSAGPTQGASGDATMEGACIGGAEIPNDGSSWGGAWTTLSVSAGGVSLSVLPTTAVIVILQGQAVPELRAVTSSGALQLTVSMPPPSSSAILQESTNLMNWTSICTNTPPFTFTDTMGTTVPYRFYRAVLGL